MSLLPLFNNTQPTLSSPNRFFLNKNLKSNILFGFFTILIICSITINLYHFINCYLEDDLEYLIIDNNNSNNNNNNNNNNDSNNKEILYNNNNNSTQIFLPDVSDPKLKDLIIVTGHAIYLGGSNNHEIGNDEENEENWILEDYQKGNGQVKAFINHVKKGIELVKENDESLLIFSGGQTRPSAGPRSEAQSYYILAQSLNLNLSSTINSTTSLNTRIITEEYARDSYENLFFSICRFNEYTNSYPRNITVIGFQFKKKRFSELHRFALKFPLDRFNYIGIDPDNTSPLGRFVGESVNSLGPFKQDLYGCHGKLLDKKLTRNPYRRSHPYQISCPELSPLLNYCPEDRIQLYPDKLPWEY